MPFLLLAAALVLVLAGGAGHSSPPPWGPGHLATLADVEPGCPPEILAAVNAALVTTDAPKIRGFADALRPFYPHAASILDARASHL